MIILKKSNFRNIRVISFVFALAFLAIFLNISTAEAESGSWPCSVHGFHDKAYCPSNGWNVQTDFGGVKNNYQVDVSFTGHRHGSSEIRAVTCLSRYDGSQGPCTAFSGKGGALGPEYGGNPSEQKYKSGTISVINTNNGYLLMVSSYVEDAEVFTVWNGSAWNNETPPPSETHLECQNNACVSVSGSGSNQCGSNSDCQSVPPPPSGFLSCNPTSQTVNVDQTVSITAGNSPDGTYTWSAPGGDPTSDNDLNFSTVYHSQGNYTATVTGGGQSASCTVSVGSSGGDGGGDPFGPQNPNLVMQICPEEDPAPCSQGVSVPVNQTKQLRAWYSDNLGQSWTDKTNESGWSLANESTNNNLTEYDYNNSCNVGYCLTYRGVRFDPVDSGSGPYTTGAFRGVVTNFRDCDTSGSGCPPINANYSGTSGQIYFRVLDPVPLPTADIKANGSDGPISISYNTPATLSWSSSNASSCSISPIGWTGISGSGSTGNLTSSVTYSLSCSGSGGSASDSVAVVVNPPPPKYTVSGYVYQDLNTSTCCSGVKNAGEPGISNRLVSLTNGSQSVTYGTTTTDASGFYRFTNMDSGGDYRVTHGVPSGYVRTTDDSVQFSLGPNKIYDFGIYLSPPSASNVTVTQPDYCVSGPAATIGWTYSDPSGSPQSAYEVQIDDQSSFNNPEVDSGKVNSGSNAYFTGQGLLQFNTTYKARVRVWNGYDQVSGWTESGSFKTPNFAFPQVNFTWTANGFSENPSPPLNSPVQFTDQTVFSSQSNPNGHRWSWLFGDSTSSTQQSPSKTYTSEGTRYITLTATDSQNQTCSRTRGPLIIQKPIPQWREVAPR